MSVRDETQDLHTELEQVPWNIHMFKGDQTETQRLSYLRVWQRIFAHLDPMVPPFLQRSQKILADMTKLEEHGVAYVNFAPDSYVTDYCDCMKQSPYPAAHVYLNYMGFLYGGQIMKKRYPDSSSLYEFDDVVYARNWVREYAIPAEDHKTYPAYITEVRDAFEYHIAISHQLGILHHVE